MKPRFLLLALAVLAMVVPAHAQLVPGQIGLYFNPVAIRVSNSTPDTGPFAFLGDNVTSRFFYGFNVGGYYEFAHTSSLDIAIDLRDSHVNGNRAILNSFLVGARIAAHPGGGRLKPYIQPFVGVGSTHSGLNARSNSRIQYGIFGGLDYSIHKNVDIRAIEVGYSPLQTINSQIFINNANYPNSQTISISSGIVFRIP